jgi:hypothetical protein
MMPPPQPVPMGEPIPVERRRRIRFVYETHRQFALGISVCRQDAHVAIGPFVIGFEWPLEEIHG